MSAYRIELVGTCDTNLRLALRGLFATVFGSDVSDQHWRWKYSGPASSRELHALAYAEGGEPVGHVGVVVQPAWETRCPHAANSGQPQPAWMAHLTDVMVRPDHRGGLGPEGVYPRMMAAMAEQLAAWQAEWGVSVYAYGFPGLTPSRLGHRMGLYRPLYRVHEHSLASQESPGWGWRVREYPLAQGFSAKLRLELDAIDQLLAYRLTQAKTQPPDTPAPLLGPQAPLAQSAPLNLPGAPRLRKGAAYVEWRYAAHPARPYRLFLLRDPFSRLRGWSVCREHPRPLVVDAQLVPTTRRVRMWAGLHRETNGSPPWRTWLAEDGRGPPEESLIVPSEFLIPGPRMVWQPSAFVPGDTDVF